MTSPDDKNGNPFWWALVNATIIAVIIYLIATAGR